LPEGYPQGEKTWSAFDIVGHLIHGEHTDWMARARMVLQFGETQAFEPFDRWGNLRESRGKSLDQLWMTLLVCGQKTWATCRH
jgi:hypothetical protein